MINFMRYRWVYLILSGLILVPGIFYLVRFGLKPAIDFTGGALIEIKVESAKNPTTEEIKKIVEAQKVEVGSIQTTSQNTFIIRTKTVEKDEHQKILDNLNKELEKVSEVRFETIGPTLGAELLKKTLVVALLAIVAILLYVAWAFKNIRFGVAAVLALIHDVLVVVSVFAILGVVKGVEVDTLFVTAVLTTMSFSVHDTIVVFDRIRESLKHPAGLNFEQLVDKALTETMSRSLNNSLTIVFMLLALFLMGGVTVKWFVFALLVGTISGSYSSPFVAAPILYIWHEFVDKHEVKN